jgi:raffinose/stachyose/melibiose transport system permease protein
MMIRSKKTKILFFEILMSVIGILMLVPLYVMVINSIKNERESALIGVSLPTEFKFDNYVQVFIKGKVLTGYMNSFIITFSTILIVLLICTSAAFVIQRRKDRFTKFVYRYIITGLILPVSLIPLIKLLMNLHLHNTYPGIIFYYCALYSPFAVFLVSGFMGTVPVELDEAAIIDGCGPIRLFLEIIVPISRTIFVTLGLLVFYNVWNDFMGPFFIVSDIHKWTIPLSVFAFITKFNARWDFVFADMTFIIAPVVIIYLFAQRYIIEGMTAGAVKS